MAKQWFRISVVGKKTDHRFAPDIVTGIQTLLRKYGVPYHEVTFEGWGDEPMTDRQRRELGLAPAANRRVAKTGLPR